MTGLDSQYLRPADLRRLKRLFFSSRRPVVGQYAGRHASPQRGRSVEFIDYRQYLPGDPLSDVDWKAYGRSDKLFIKLFEHQSDMAINLLLDGSASMAYGKGQGERAKGQAEIRLHAPPTSSTPLAPGPFPLALGPHSPALSSKFDHAARLAAAIAFLTTQQRDRVSFGVAQEGLRNFLPARESPDHLQGILAAMEHTRPGGTAGLPAALRQMIGAIPRRGLLIVLSDLLDDQDQILAALTLFAHRGGQAILFHVMHPDELRLPDLPGGEALFLDSEAPQRVTVNVAELRQEYDVRIKQFLQSWAAACAHRGIDYKLVSTATPCHQALEQYLYSRASGG